MDDKDMIAEIDLHENALYYVKDGKMKKVEKPPTGFGKHTVNWQNGKVSHVDHHYTEKA